MAVFNLKDDYLGERLLDYLVNDAGFINFYAFAKIILICSFLPTLTIIISINSSL